MTTQMDVSLTAAQQYCRHTLQFPSDANDVYHSDNKTDK